jgi:hypothetical protein
MWEFLLKAGWVTCVILTLDAVWAIGAGAQSSPTERPVPSPVAESSRGFTSITSVRELDGGRVLVADRGEGHLYVVDWKTGAVDQILRQGDGPGENRAIGWLYAVGDNETLITDIARRRWILLTGTDVADTFVGTGPLNRRFRSRLDGVAADGRVLGSVSAEYPGSSAADIRVIELAAGMGPHDRMPRLDTIARVQGAGRHQIACVLATTGREPACQFLEAEGQAILFPDGWIAIGLQDPYRTFWHSPDGNLIQGEMLPDDSVAASEAEKCAALNGWQEADIACDAATIAGYLWPDVLPPFLSDSRLCAGCRKLAAGEAPWLFADPHGRLVVRRTPHRSRRENLYDVVDRTGRLVKRVVLPLNEAIVGFGKTTVYTIRMDEYDLQWLRRHPWGN